MTAPITTARGALSVSDVRRAVWRRKKQTVFWFVVILAAAGGVMCVIPRAYRSEAKLLVRLGRENATLDPTTTLTPDRVVALPQTRENEINSVAEVLGSRAMVEKVVESFGPAKLLDQEESEGEVADGWPEEAARQARRGIALLKNRLRDLWGESQMTDRDRAVQQVLEALYVAPGKRSNLIQVTYKAKSPELAQQVVAKLVDSYLEEHVRLNRPQGSYEFLAQQTERLRRELTRSEEELRDLKNTTGLASPGEQRQMLVTRVGRIEDELLQAEAARTVALSRIGTLKKQLAGLPETRLVSRTSGVGNEGTDRIREQFYALQVKRAETGARYTSMHPQLQAIDEQVLAAEGLLGREEATRTHDMQAPNRLHEEVRLALLQEEPALAALEARRGALRGQLAAVHKELKTFNENELRMAKLQRDIELEQASYRKYAASLEQARMDGSLEAQRMSNISVVQPASFEARPASPKMAGSLLLALAAAVLGSVGMALLAERRDRRLRTAGDIERRLEVRVLASVPRLPETHLVLQGNGKR